jgi:DNA-binding MarR family transcriptional regulator
MSSLLLDDQLCFALYSAGAAMNRVYRKLLRNLDLNYPQFLVMTALWECDSISTSHITDRLCMDPQILFPLLEHLAKSNLINMSDSNSDESKVVTLSEGGLAMAKDARAIYDDVRCVVAYGPSDFAQMKHGLELLRDKLTKA